MLNDAGEVALAWRIAVAAGFAVAGIWPLAAGLSGYLLRPIGWGWRSLLFVAAALALFPGQWEGFGRAPMSWENVLGATLFLGVLGTQWGLRRREGRRER